MMEHHKSVPHTGTLKNQAKRLRQDLAENDMQVSHSKSLEMLAHQYGFKDWNGLSAAAQTNSLLSTLHVGQTVEGRYLGQKFVGEVLGLQKLTSGKHYRLTLDMDEPIDVVSFDSFSSLRKRVVCQVDEGGVSPEKTSNGKPHMVLGGAR